MGVQDDYSGVRNRGDALDDALHRIFAAALDLSAALPDVADRRASIRIHAAIDRLDAATKDLRIDALRRRPGTRGGTAHDTPLFIAFRDEES